MKLKLETVIPCSVMFAVENKCVELKLSKKV